jgi:hypothetical protein
MWTASSAGWLVLGYATGVDAAYYTSAGCGMLALAWHVAQNWETSDD